MSQYELRQELDPAHSSDVKAVTSIGSDKLASASRDQSVAIWSQKAGKYELTTLLHGHDAYVNSLAHVRDVNGTEGGFVASGGNSALILLHSLQTLSPDAVECLIGHTLNVCTLEYSAKHGKLISGSWDHTARVWSKSPAWDCELVLAGHEEAVWGVTIVDDGPRDGCYLTGSADRLIILWDAHGEQLLRIKGSPEPVRSLTLLPEGTGFASACNDGKIRIWDWTGSTTAVLSGHDDYAYEVVGMADGALVSCGEDHTARVWPANGSTIEPILHPCQTVWCVAGLTNGDIATGGSDGKVRIWTRDEASKASGDVREAYALLVEGIARAKRDSQASGINASVLTIDIDLSDDDPPLQLRVDPKVDPRMTAEAFGREHGLSENYINQIEAFVRQHLA